MQKNIFSALSFVLASFFLNQASIASVADDDFSAASKLFDTGLTDMDRSKAKYKAGNLTYIPRLNDGKVQGFKVIAGKKQVLSVSQPDDFGTFIWLVHPLEGLSRSKNSGESNQKLCRGEWDVVGKTFRSMQSPFVDINADGKLEVIVGSFSGGAHCCSTYKVYALDKPNRLLDTIDGLDGHFVFADLDGDKKIEAVGGDMTYRYWNTCFAGSPSPTVILRLDSSSKYRLALDLMRTPAPSAEKFDRMVAESKNAIEKASQDYEPDQGATINLAPELWKNMLELIYSGHSKDAWRLAHQAWPEEKKALFTHNPDNEKSFGAGGPDEFIGALLIQMRKSPYWKSLSVLNSSDAKFSAVAKNASKTKVIMGPSDCKD